MTMNKCETCKWLKTAINYDDDNDITCNVCMNKEVIKSVDSEYLPCGVIILLNSFGCTYHYPNQKASQNDEQEKEVTVERKSEVTSEKIEGKENEWKSTIESDWLTYKVDGDSWEQTGVSCSGATVNWLHAEATRIFKEHQERKVLVERLEKYEKCDDLAEKAGFKACCFAYVSDNYKEGCSEFEKHSYDKFLSHLVELLDSVKNQDKIDKWILSKDWGTKITFHRNGFRDCYTKKVDFYIKSDIYRIASHLHIPELEAIADMILTITKGETDEN